MIKHYLNFVSTNRGLIEIDEPTGFDQAVFEIMQEDGRHGRDIFSVTNEKGKLTLDRLPNHCFDYVMEAIEQDGFEAEIKYQVAFDGEMSVVGDVSCQAAVTDDVNKIELAIVEENFKTIFKKRFDVKTNLFNDKSLDDADIAPVQTVKALFKAKPIVQVSEWTNPIIGKQLFFNNPYVNADYFNPIKNQVTYDILNSLSWLEDTNTDSGGGFGNFAYVQAVNKLTNINVKISVNITIDYLPQLENDNPTGKNGQVLLRLYYGASTSSYSQVNVFDVPVFQGTSNQQYILNQTFEVPIELVNSTEKIWFSFVSGTGNGAVIKLTFFDCTVNITATSTAYNSVIDIVNLYDAMKYNALSSANLPVSAPRWEFGGHLQNLFITSQALMRGLLDKPFSISTKDIVEEYLPMVNGDYQIQQDGTIFYGVEEDFYRDYEILSLTQQDATDEFGQPLGQIEGFERSFNKEYTVNEFKFGFQNYASKKETTQGNTYDIVHGQFETLLPNKRVENKKNVEVGFIFDAFEWESARQKAFDLSENTATQDDDKIYCAEFVALTDADRLQKETISVDHRATQTDFNLQLVNNESFGWIRIGLFVGDTVTIDTGVVNTGTYTVTEVTERILYLVTTGGFPQNIGIVNTTITYHISPNVLWVNRTNEGFTEITGIADGDNFGNLAHTAKRSALNYWSSYLATCCMYKQGQEIKITDYKNNPDAVIQENGEAEGIREGDNFVPEGAILTPYLVEVKGIMSLQKFFDTQTKQRLHNGYIRSFDANRLPLLGYIKQANFIPQTKGGIDAEDIIGECAFVLKEKYQEFYLQILGSGNGMIVLSNGESASDFNFYIENKKLYIFDETGKQLFVPVPFNRVKVNSSTQAATPEQLEQWLNLLKQ